MKQIIIYLRTSSEIQNPENQLRDCETLAQKLNLNDYEVIQEQQSAFKDINRKYFEIIKSRIQKGEVVHLICWDWDRLFRNRKKLKEFFQFCSIYKCKIHSFRQNFFEDFYKIPSPFDEIIQELVLNLMGWLAEDESQKKSDRVKIAFKNKKGDWGRPALNPKIDNQIIKLFKEGKSLREISKEVFYWNANKNKRFVSLGYVHKTINNFKEQNLRLEPVQ